MAKTNDKSRRSRTVEPLPSEILGPFILKEDLKSDLSELGQIRSIYKNSSDKRLKDLNKKLSSLDNQQKKLEVKIEEQNKKISSDKNRTIETLGVFVALFTFISAQVQIFQKINDPKKIISLSLTTGGLITFFVLILDLMIKTHDEADGLLRVRFFLLLALSIALITAGSFLTIL